MAATSIADGVAMLLGLLRTSSNVSQDHRNALAIEEYKSLRELNLTNIKIVEKNETYVISAVTAVFLFGVAVTNHFLFQAQGVIAFSGAMIGTARYISLDHVISVADAYLRECESDMPNGGWSNFYRAHGSGPLGWSRVLLWALVVALSEAWMIYCLGHDPIGYRPT